MPSLRIWLRRIAVTAAVILFTGGLVVGVIAMHRAHRRAEHSYYRHLNTACAAHRGTFTLVAPGNTGAYVVCRDGYVPPKVER